MQYAAGYALQPRVVWLSARGGVIIFAHPTTGRQSVVRSRRAAAMLMRRISTAQVNGSECWLQNSDPAGASRRDLLDQPCIAVGILEGEERPVARALGVRAGEPCLLRERRAVPHVTRVDTTASEFGMSRSNVRDNQRPHGCARRCRG